MYIWGKGRVGSDFLTAIAGRVGSGQRYAGSGPGKVAREQLYDVIVQFLNVTKFKTEEPAAANDANNINIKIKLLLT